jgi:hypothetical protein
MPPKPRKRRMVTPIPTAIAHCVRLSPTAPTVVGDRRLACGFFTTNPLRGIPLQNVKRSGVLHAGRHVRNCYESGVIGRFSRTLLLRSARI